MSAGVGYANVPRSTWTRFDEREVGADGRLVYMALRSGPDSTLVPGIVATGPGKLHDATKIPVARVKRALQDLERAELIQVDWPRGLVLDRECIATHYWVASGSLIRGWLKVWSKLPRSPLLGGFMECIALRCDLASADVVAALREVAAAHNVPWSAAGGPSPWTLPPERQRGASTDSLPPDPPPGASTGSVNGQSPPGPSQNTLPPEPLPPFAHAGDSEQRTAKEENTHTTGAAARDPTAPGSEEPSRQPEQAEPPAEPPADGEAPSGAASRLLTLDEESARFRAAWEEFYKLGEGGSTEPDAAFTVAWVRIRGTATARRVEALEYAQALMLAWRELGTTFTAPYTWSPALALFDKHFTAIVSWQEGQRPKPKPSRAGPPPAVPSGPQSRRVDQDPEFVERARRLQSMAGEGRAAAKLVKR
jgi:hypothetical protein